MGVGGGGGRGHTRSSTSLDITSLIAALQGLNFGQVSSGDKPQARVGLG